MSEETVERIRKTQEWDEMSDSKKRLVGLMILGSTLDGGRSDA